MTPSSASSASPGEEPGSLKEYGIGYRQVDVTPDNLPDKAGLAQAVQAPDVKVVLIQRSKGYSTRASLSVAEIGALIAIVKEHRPDVTVIVDNCYGEFVETMEPTQVGADLIVGSLIKNPGGGLAPTGGYLAGRHDLVEAAAKRLTVPGIGQGVRLHPGQQPPALSGAVPSTPHRGAGG